MFSISTAPAKQSVGETITVLSGRLSSATLLEDRRAAILGLRSFAKDFPASVASGALRSLIGSLSKDAEDVDTVKVVLETLLMLFSPNEDSPEASEEIALWLADEFTMRQENITLLLDFLDSSDFYSRLYSLQLLAAILSARTERTEECVFTAPLGISRLVAVLDDSREAVRNEAITLLTYLTPSSTDIQKLVAFENAFDRVFNIIISEGSLSEGDRVVEDCLILVANLLRRNPSNQSLFRESGGIRRLAVLLEGAGKAQREEAEIAAWAQTQRNRNIYALLAVVRLFLVPGAVGTAQNQLAFWQHGLLYHALQLAFSRVAQLPIKAEALETCADIIKGNASLQEGFAQLQVPSPLDTHTPVEVSQPNSAFQVYVIDGLLDLALGVEDTEAFDLRLAASDCLKAYFYSHADIRLHFLRRAIEGHKTGADETANVLTVLLRPSPNADITNPYRSWFAATIMFHLVFDNPEAKSLAMAVTEGDAESGEEVVTSIQIVAAHLISGLNREGDSRVVVGYLMLLLGWLFEDLDAVNDFLGEGSNTQSIIQAINHPYPSGEIVQGLCAMLLGVLYEFSTKDSPIPRTDFHSILVSRMGRERYIDKLSKLRSNPLVRDFEVIPQKLSNSGSGKLPDVYFDATFVEFFKDNYSRILRGIDRDPGLEISVVSNGVQKGVSRELVDSLRSQLAEKDQALQEAQDYSGSMMQSFERDHKKQMAEIQVKTDRRIATLDEERKAIDQRQKEEIDRIQKEVKAQVAAQSEEHRKELEHARKTAENDAERVRHRAEADMADLKATISRLEVDLMKAKKTKTQEMQAFRDDSTRKLQEQEDLIKKAESRGKQLESELRETREKAIQREAAVRKAEEDKQATQNELDDLLMVFGDLEDKVAKYKAQLKALGEAVSDGEEEQEDSDEDDEEEDDEEEDDEDDAKSEDANGTKT
ncbi:Intracellular protein transport protein USO1 [Colletotrichum sp. SAR 10_70]|nr:Intracellular protein transport protein USO1 [Colletotrichum sp. SAR 10_71]KAI8177764.1 Intracellular protein transport protein USO1 [Colletotrichum sp. SAR 10_70]KAI8179916.1 Intracellular protein transport protein USO1 [Colletotrichum sp. SAR 10_75]KAI8196416.1 Intracellular protein transport protein USO1 [Colletotrichum sp. SAR 10_65]KAI8227426.1 Intracellular protein transport protein USO1 [Colletotrichum sp. SAR 10_86]KAI8247238.1 Intracellular protein transport protein USO1 [Colletotr